MEILSESQQWRKRNLKQGWYAVTVGRLPQVHVAPLGLCTYTAGGYPHRFGVALSLRESHPISVVPVLAGGWSNLGDRPMWAQHQTPLIDTGPFSNRGGNNPALFVSSPPRNTRGGVAILFDVSRDRGVYHTLVAKYVAPTQRGATSS